MEINPNPYPVEAHAVNVGVLVTQLQVLEFAARVAIGKTRPQFSIGYLQGIQPGDVVTEDPLNDYDQLSAILMRLNKLAPADRQLDVQALVDLRDQLAHGRVAL